MLRDGRSRGMVKGEPRNSAVVQVKGGVVSGKMIGSRTVDRWSERRTEKNVLDLENLAKAEAQLQAAVECEEGLFQAGESRGLTDDGGSLENAPCHWRDRIL